MGDSAASLESLGSADVHSGKLTENLFQFSHDLAATEQHPDGENDDLERRSFVIKGLRQRGWRKSDELFTLFEAAESFTIEFRPNDESEGKKRGMASFVFSDKESALRGYKIADSIRVYGKPVEIDASNNFFSSECSRFTALTDESEKERTLYVLNLPPDAKKDFLENIFGADDMESCQFLPMANTNEKQAKITFVSPEAAKMASEDAEGFVIDDEEHECLLKVVFWEEYDKVITEAAKAQILQKIDEPIVDTFELLAENRVMEDGNKENQQETTSEQFEVNEENIVSSINQLIQAKRINFVDWNGPEDIYPELDEVSKLYGGLPDSLLKPCLLDLLERHLQMEKPGWMRQHLETLIKIWKKEVISTVVYERPTRIPLAARALTPTLATKDRPKKRKRQDSNNDARKKLGVGAFLQTLLTEQGPVDVDEDETGNYTIGGEPLTFDTWVKFNKSEITMPPPIPTPSRGPRILTKEERAKIRLEKRMASKARRKANRALKIATMKGEENVANEGMSAEVKVLEEGEVDSGEEKKDRSKRLKASTSSSSSSSESDDDAEAQGSRHRRRERRKQERMGTVRTSGTRLPWILQSLFDNRVELMNLLSLEHRAAFANVLNTVMSNEKAMTSSQRDLMLSQMNLMFRGT